MGITVIGQKMLRSGRVAPRTPEQLLFSLDPVLATAENMAWSEPEESWTGIAEAA